MTAIFVTTLGISAPLANSQSLERQNYIRMGDLISPGVEDFIAFRQELDSKRKESQNLPKSDKELVSELARNQKNIAKIKDSLPSQKTVASRAKLQRKLGELYLKQADLQYELEAGKVQERAVSRFVDGQDLTPAIKEKDLSRFIGFLRDGVESLRAFEASIGSDKLPRSVRFELGLALLRLGSPEAQHYFLALIKKEPSSQLGRLAQLGLIEFYMDQGKTQEAAQALDKFLAGKFTPTDAVYRQFGLYRKAWINIVPALKNQGSTGLQISQDFEDAVKKMGIPLAKPAKAHRGDVYDFQNEVKKDLVQLWAIQKNEPMLQSYLSGNEHASLRSFFWMTRGFYSYKAKDFVDAAASMQRYFQGLSPDQADMKYDFLAHLVLMRSYQSTNSHLGIQQSVARAVAQYATQSKKQGLEPLSLKFIQDAIKQETKKTLGFYKPPLRDSPGLIEAALNLHALYVKAYPKDRDIAEYLVAIGDLHYQQNQVTLGLQSYLRVFAHKPEDTQATKNALIRLDERVVKPLLSQKIVLDVNDPGFLSDLKKCSLDTKVYVQAVDRYLAAVANHQNKTSLQFKGASLLIGCNDIESGVAKLLDLIKKEPQSVEYASSVELVAKIWTLKKDYARLVHWTKGLLPQKEVKANSQLLTFVLLTLKNSLWASGQENMSQKRLGAALIAFGQLHEFFPKDPLAEEALRIIVTSESERGSAIGVIANGLKLLQGFPGSKYREEIVKHVSLAYAQKANFEEAGLLLTNYSVAAKTDINSPSLYAQGVTYLKYSENLDLEAQKIKEFINLFPMAAEASSLHERLCEIYVKQEQWKDAAREYQALAAKFHSLSPAKAEAAKAKFIVLASQRPELRPSGFNYGALAGEILAQPLSALNKEAKATIAEENLRLLKRDIAQYVASLGIPSDGFKAFEAGTIRILRDFEVFSSRLSGIVPHGDPTVHAQAYYQVGLAFETLRNLFLAGIDVRYFSKNDADSYYKRREEILSLTRIKIQTFWENALAFAARDASAHDLQRKIGYRIAQIKQGRSSEIFEDVIEPQYITHRVSRK